MFDKYLQRYTIKFKYLINFLYFYLFYIIFINFTFYVLHIYVLHILIEMTNELLNIVIQFVDKAVTRITVRADMGDRQFEK
jgi:hypothetical protein